MSGWIKLEKDLRDDVRVRRMASALQGTPYCNGTALHPVTLVLGGLTQLWMHADSFARDDDTLEITLDEIDQITGIKGFAQTLPPDWLEVLDEHTVKLPGFHDHNGSDAKRRALTAKRVEKHRKRISVTPSSEPVTQERYQTRLDQTRQDQRGEETKERFAPPPGLDMESFSKWENYRTEIGKPLAPASLFAAQRKLAAFGAEQAAVVEQSIANGWHGLFHLKKDRAEKKDYIPPKTIAQLEAEEAARGQH